MTPDPIDVVAAALVFVLIAGSMLGAIIPAFPGLVMAWAAVVVFGFVAGWDGIAIVIVTLVTLLTIATYVAMVRIPQKQVEQRGASRAARRGGPCRPDPTGTPPPRARAGCAGAALRGRSAAW